MSRLIGRIFLVALFSAAVAWGVWAFALKRTDLQMSLYAKSADLRHQAAKPKAVDAKAFRATACASGPCILVEAGGFSFLVGAGDGAAEGLAANGLMRADLKAVLLTDLAARSIEGLPSVRDATWRAGRREPLLVYGPAGAERVVTGVNAMLEASDAGEAARLTSAALAPESAPLSLGTHTDSTIFQSGAVKVSAYPLIRADVVGQIYRFDFDGRVLVVAGCSAVADDFTNASRGATSAYAVVPAASLAMVEIERSAAASAGRDREASLIAASAKGCLSAEDAATALSRARISGGMLAPLSPAPRDPPAARAWGVAVASSTAVPLIAGAPGTSFTIDAKPRPGGVPAEGPPAVAVANPLEAPATTAKPVEAKPTPAAPKPIVVPAPSAPKPAPAAAAPKPAASPAASAPKPAGSPAASAPKPAATRPPSTASPKPTPSAPPVVVASPSPTAPAPQPVVTPSPTPTEDALPPPTFPLRTAPTNPLLRPTPTPTP